MLGGCGGAEESHNVGSFAQVLETLPGDAVGLSWWSHLPGKASAVHSTHRGEVSQCFQVKVHVHSKEELPSLKGGREGSPSDAHNIFHPDFLLLS